MCSASYVLYKGVNMPHPCTMAVVVSCAGLTDALPPALPYTKFPLLPITWGRASPITFTYRVLCYPPPPPNRLPMQANRGVAWPPTPPGARGHPSDLRGAQGRESEMWQMRGAGCRMQGASKEEEGGGGGASKARSGRGIRGKRKEGGERSAWGRGVRSAPCEVVE